MIRFVINFAEFREALRALPAEVTAEARGIVHSHGDAAGHKVKAAYPRRSGELQDGVSVEHVDTQYKAVARVVSRAIYAQAYEHGTQVRSYKGASRGASRPHPTLIPIVMRERRAMDNELAAIVERHGFKVTRGR